MFFRAFSRTTRAKRLERNERAGERAEESVQKQDVAVTAEVSVTAIVFGSITACALHFDVLLKKKEDLFKPDYGCTV